MSNFPRRAFVRSDGVQLSYIRQGAGRPIVLIHGWSQCAEEFKHQIEPLSARYDVIAVDRDFIPRINLPTLIISGRASAIPWKSQEWIHRQIKGSQFEVFEESEGGQHFMFIENPEKFNRLVMEYLR
jgi:pimeloyl-ACP methyl ester carboxylesterase